MKKEIQYKNSPLVYFQFGKGLPVILLHGFGETNAVWKNQAGPLSKICKLIVPDLPGSGQSPLMELHSKKLSMNMLADAVYAIIQNEKIDKCVMLGHSMGGYITLAFAEKYPELLKAYGLVHSTAFPDSKEKKQIRLKGIDVIEKYGSYAFLKTAQPGLFSAGFKKKHTEVVNDLIEEGRSATKKSLQQYYYAMMNRPDRTSVLRDNNLPVLFVLGTEDNAAPLSDVLQQVHLPEIAYIHILENTGHMSMLEKPLKLKRILKDFIHEME
ncbi:MAG: alpha/beta hydrolase [Bacteroidetes bacterium]|nr:alpha/beta hydrolase [Bacteroidota bacterium]